MGAPSADHRTRVAALRRERTRARLLQSAVRVVAERGTTDVPIDELLALAGVSRGTFYKYFPDAPSLLAAAAQAVSDELIVHLRALPEAHEDPARRMAVGFCAALALLQSCPPLAALITRIGWPHVETAPSHALFTLAGRDVAAGLESGRFAALDRAFAIDLVPALMIAAAHRLGAGPTPPDFAAQVAAAALRGLGLGAEEAARLSRAEVVLPPPAEGSLLAALASHPGPAGS